MVVTRRAGPASLKTHTPVFTTDVLLHRSMVFTSSSAHDLAENSLRLTSSHHSFSKDPLVGGLGPPLLRSRAAAVAEQ